MKRLLEGSQSRKPPPLPTRYTAPETVNFVDAMPRGPQPPSGNYRLAADLPGRTVAKVRTIPNDWLRAVLQAWLPVAVVATVLAATSYAMTQEVTRSSANDAPRAAAQRAVNALSSGAAPAAVTLGALVDLATDLSPFLTVHGPDGAVLSTTARLDGVTPVVPPGVLAEARRQGIDQVTWQPRSGVRAAIIAMPWRSAAQQGVVVAGASLRPAEDRQGQLLLLLLAGWLVALLGSFAMAAIGVRWLGPHPAPLGISSSN